ERYLLLPFWIACVFAAVGAVGLVRIVFDRGAARTDLLATLTVFAAALTIGWSNRGLLALRHDDAAARLVDTVRRVTPANAIVIASWSYATPLAYAEYVEHAFGTRIIETAWVGDDRTNLARWAKLRPVYVVSQEAIALPGAQFVLVADGGAASVYRYVP
ncbi:MAG: hypothetical protein ACREM8_08860, partial [Vulcanimicrobiaceae bacterium]